MNASKPTLTAYVDTNIFDYVALKHPRLGRPCKRITDDIRDGVLEAYCSHLVPIEILGSLAKVDPQVANGAVLAFFSFPVKMIALDGGLIKEASRIMLETGVTYDSIHAAAMERAGLNTVITEDVDHWRRMKGVKIIRPIDYQKAKNESDSRQS